MIAKKYHPPKNQQDENTWYKGLRSMTLPGSSIESKEISLTQSQFLIGSEKTCDAVINHETVAAYQILFLVTPDLVEVIDVSPSQTSRINGKKFQRQPLVEGDILSFGESRFEFLSELKPGSIVDLNEKLVNVVPPPLRLSKPFISDNPTHSRGVTFVDDEECFLELPLAKESELNDAYVELVTNLENYYIDVEVEKEFRDCKKTIESKTEILLSYYISGKLYSLESITENELLGKNWFQFIPKEWQTFFSKKENPFSLDGKKIQFAPPEGFHLKFEKNAKILTLNKEFQIVTNDIHQLGLAIKMRDTGLTALPINWRDQKQFQEIFKYFTAIILPFLFLFLAEIPKKQEERKEIVVIYAPPEVVLEEQKKDAAAAPAISKQKDKSNNFNAPVKQKTTVSETTPNQKTENAPPAPRAADVVKDKFSTLFGKTDVPSDKQPTNEGKPQVGTLSGTSAILGAMNGSKGTGKLGTVGGGSVKGFDTDSSLSGKNGFKSGNGKGTGDFDSSFTATKTVVLGSIDPELLRKILREYIPQFRYCYQNELSSNPNLSGTIDLNFTINGAGKIAKSSVLAKGSSFSPRGINCIDGVLKMIPFPKPKGGGQVDVRQPLNFSSERTKL